MSPQELKQAVAEKIANDYGIWVNRHLPMRALCRKVMEHTGNRIPVGQSDSMYLHNFIKPPVYTPLTIIPFRPMVVKPHMRQADINAAQPPFTTIHGVGNGAEPSPVWRR